MRERYIRWPSAWLTTNICYVDELSWVATWDIKRDHQRSKRHESSFHNLRHWWLVFFSVCYLACGIYFWYLFIIIEIRHAFRFVFGFRLFCRANESMCSSILYRSQHRKEHITMNVGLLQTVHTSHTWWLNMCPLWLLSYDTRRLGGHATHSSVAAATMYKYRKNQCPGTPPLTHGWLRRI